MVLKELIFRKMPNRRGNDQNRRKWPKRHVNVRLEYESFSIRRASATNNYELTVVPCPEQQIQFWKLVCTLTSHNVPFLAIFACFGPFSSLFWHFRKINSLSTIHFFKRCRFGNNSTLKTSVESSSGACLMA